MIATPWTTDLVHTLDRVVQGRDRPGDGYDGATTTAAASRRHPRGSGADRTAGTGDVASAVELVTRVLRVKPGDRGEQFAADITDDSRQMFVAKANGQIIGYGRVAELAAGEAGPGAER